MKKVGIVIVNYKKYANKFLAECRDSLRLQNYPKDLYQVYIVDNASSEDSLEYLKKHYSEAIIIPRMDGNYSAANNAGIKKAIEDGCEYFVIANMDTRMTRDWLRELVIGIERDKEIGIVQSKMLLYPKNKEEWKKPKMNSIGNIINFLGFGFTNGYNESDEKIAGYPEIGYASGCSFITRKDVLDNIGFYDEEYYMYHDDIEMSTRVKLAGYKIVLAPKSVIYHKYEFSRSVQMIYFMERNRFLFIFQYYKIPTILIILPPLIVMQLGMILYFIKGKIFKSSIKVLVYFLKPNTWSKIIQKRKEIGKIRKVKDKEIIKNYEGRILFQEIANPVLNYIVNPLLNIYWKIVKKLVIW